jgi:rhodanese-related sulfurtransferase
MHILPGYILLSVFGWMAITRKRSFDESIIAASVESVRNRLRRKGTLLIDVRKKDKRLISIPHSTSLPLEKLTIKIPEIAKKDTPIILYCEDGSRSYQAAKLLYFQGFTNVTDMIGGIITWKDAGYPTSR